MKAVLLSIMVVAAVSAAPAAAAPSERGPEATSPAVPPATLSVWNHPIAVFRAPLRNVSPAERAERAAQRIAALPADVGPDEIKTEAATVGDLNGMLVLVRNQILFGISIDDLDPGTGETLESAGAHAVDGLRAVLRARADQRR